MCLERSGRIHMTRMGKVFKHLPAETSQTLPNKISQVHLNRMGNISVFCLLRKTGGKTWKPIGCSGSLWETPNKPENLFPGLGQTSLRRHSKTQTSRIEIFSRVLVKKHETNESLFFGNLGAKHAGYGEFLMFLFKEKNLRIYITCKSRVLGFEVVCFHGFYKATYPGPIFGFWFFLMQQ